MFGMTTTATETNQASDMDAASKQVEQAQSDLTNWQERAANLRSEIASLQERAGVDVLQSGDVSGVARKLSEKRDELQVTEQTIEAAQHAVRVAERQYQQADAAAKRVQAAELRKQADDLDAKCEKPLAQLRELQGVEYEPSRPTAGVASDRTIQVARSTSLRNQASGLEKQAAEIERKLNRAV